MWFFILVFYGVFAGQLVQGQPTIKKDCPTGEHWVSAYVQPDYYKADGTYVQAHRVSAYCRKNPRGYDVWHSKLKNGKPRVWGYKQEKSKEWKVEEVERVLEALSVLPQLLLDQGVQGFFRMTRAEGRQAVATTNVALGDTVLYDAAFETKHNLTFVVAHELSHQLYEDISESKRKDYRKKLLWEELEIKAGRIFVSKRPTHQFMNEQARGSPDEDFASNIEYFLFKPSELKKTVPQAYEWIKTNFDDTFGVTLKK